MKATKPLLLIKTAAALVVSALISLTAAAESSGFSCEKELALPARTPYDPKYVDVIWSDQGSSEAGVPLTWGGSVLLPAGNKIRLLSEKEGAELGTVELNEKVSKQYKGAVLGNTLLQPTETGLSAINLQTMEKVTQKSFGAQISSNAAIIDNLAYVAVSDENGYRFICCDLSNALDIVWEYNSAEAISSPSAYGEYVLFTSGTKLICCNYKTGEAIENELGAKAVGEPFSGQYAVYTAAEDGCVYKLRLNDDGSMEDGTLTPCEIGGTLKTPVQWDGKLYVSSTEGFFVLDSLNMEVTATLPEIAGGTAPLVCYGSGTRVYITAPLGDYWCLYSIHDDEEMDAPAVSKLAKLNNFQGGKTVAGENGTMYFCDAKGRLYAFGIVKYNWWLIAVKLLLLLGLFVLVILLLRQWVKNKNNSRPPQY